MKKMLLLATAATLLSMNANANMMQDMKPYIGLDYVYTDADISKVDHVSMYKHKFDSANINIGMRTCNMGVEAYYQMSTKEKKTVLDTYKTKTDFYSFGADLMGYKPVYEKVELIGALGLGQYDFTAKGHEIATGQKLKHRDDSGIGIRMGAGVQYNFTDHFAVRAMGRYTWLDVDHVNHLQEFVIGARYSF